MVHENESHRPAFVPSLLILMITLSSLAIPAYATSSSIQNVKSTHLALGAMQDANSTGEALGLGWLSEDVPADARVTPVYAAALPTHFDWRSNSGSSWMTPVKNQGGCGSCVAFGAVGATEAQFRIQASNPGWSLDLSEQHLFSCGGGSCSRGWYISAALNYLKNSGTPDESCSPYQNGQASCSNSCPDWQSRAFKIASWSWVANNPSALQAALMNGPLVAGFNVYSDFFSYRGGVYHYDGHSSLAGGHAIVIVGYDSNEQYWIVKNSWGSYWGDGGYFRIGFGEAGIENYVASIKAAISPLSIAVSGPAGGESWQAGSAHAITWTSSGTADSVNIWYNVGSDWTNIVFGAPNTGGYQWTVPSVSSTNARVGIDLTRGGAVIATGYSGYFTIAAPSPPSTPSVSITSPAGSESWQAGTAHTITWTLSGACDWVNIWYNAGGGWVNIVFGAPNTGSFSWTVPNAPSTNARVGIDIIRSGRVAATGYSGYFTIAGSPPPSPPSASITVTSPVDGVSWQVGSAQAITWTATGACDWVNIWYNAGGGWVNIVFGAPNTGSFSWTVPNAPSTNARVGIDIIRSGRVAATGYSGYFTIAGSPPPSPPSASITVTSPVDGVSWQVGSTYTITWTSTGTCGYVNIWYDAGAGWVHIAAVPNTGSFSWTVPNAPSTNARVGIDMVRSGAVVATGYSGYFAIVS